MGGHTGASREITPEAGRALQILGHAIDYLVDTAAARIERGSSLRTELGALDAVELLKARNREIYFACPVIQPMKQRFLHRFYGMMRQLWRGLITPLHAAHAHRRTAHR